MPASIPDYYIRPIAEAMGLEIKRFRDNSEVLFLGDDTSLLLPLSLHVHGDIVFAAHAVAWAAGQGYLPSLCPIGTKHRSYELASPDYDWATDEYDYDPTDPTSTAEATIRAVAEVAERLRGAHDE